MARIKFYNKETGQWEYADKALSIGSGSSIDIDESDALDLVVETGLVSPVADEDGSIYTDENGVLYSL